VIKTASLEPKSMNKFCKLFPSTKTLENAKHFALTAPYNFAFKKKSSLKRFFFLFKSKIYGWNI